MSDTIKIGLRYLALGVRDSFLGLIRIPRLDEETEEEREERQRRRQAPLSTLARRRARDKGKEQKQESEPKILHRILLCCGWNGGVFWLSILIFNHILLPCMQFMTQFFIGGSSSHGMIWSWLGPMLSWTFNTLWILPLFVISKIVNNLWFQDVADKAFKKSRGRAQMMSSLSKMIAEILFSVVLQSIFLIQGMLASFLPISVIGQLVNQIHMCLLYSLYAFEYKWFNMGWEAHKRLGFMEINWPYFVGFGLPLAVLTSLPSSILVSGCVFSILFPLFIISAHEASVITTPFEYPLRLFSPAIWLSNAIFHQSVKGTAALSAKGSQAAGSSQQDNHGLSRST